VLLCSISSALPKKLVTAKRQYLHIPVHEKLNLYIFTKVCYSHNHDSWVLWEIARVLLCSISSALLKKLVTAKRRYLHIPVHEKLNLYIFTKVCYSHNHDSWVLWEVARVLLCSISSALLKKLVTAKGQYLHIPTGETKFIHFHKSVLKSQP